jgi:hypothetical protein
MHLLVGIQAGEEGRGGYQMILTEKEEGEGQNQHACYYHNHKKMVLKNYGTHQ